MSSNSRSAPCSVSRSASPPRARSRGVSSNDSENPSIDVDGNPINLFPEPDAIADADLTTIGVVRARAAAINGIARAVRDGIVSIDRDQPLDDFVASWTQLQGIGDWTAHYIAMRALSHSNAFPAADLVLRRAVARDGKPVPLRELYAIAEAWQPWRAYAVLHLWRVAP